MVLPVKLSPLLFGSLVLAGVATFVACRENPDIDGSLVPKIGSESAPPSCSAVCARLEALCGYAPVECQRTCEEEGDEGVRLCRGQAASCREALDCVPESADGGEEGDAGEADASEASDADVADVTDAGEREAGDGGDGG